MNSSIDSIILGVSANILTSLIGHIGQKGKKLLTGKDLLKKLNLQETALAPILQEATKSLSEDIEWTGPGRIEEVCLFLTSPEVESIVRHIYSTKLTEKAEEDTVESIRTNFVSLFSLFTGLEEQKVRKPASLLFNSLIDVCEQTLSMATDRGLLSAHEAKSALRHHMLLDELKSIRKKISFLTTERQLDIKEIFKFEQKYREQVAIWHGFITPPHFDIAKRVPIDDIYVPNDFFKIPSKKREPSIRLKTPELLSIIYRAVILGNPGGGKSTLTLKLCYDLATRYTERLLAGRQATPILVVLRDYGVEKKARNCSILQFIESTANSKYQVTPPPCAFEYLLLNGRVVVIFDGLDELLDTSYRQEVTSNIESFCNLFPSIPIIVTSREVGYEQAPLDPKRFEIFRLSPFDEDQVQEYVTKWFALDTDSTPDQNKQKASSFLQESEPVSDLRSNPLMLALMCNIYRGENYIPRNRPDVYEKCAIMLFERWDKSRGVLVPLPIEAHISPAMKYLAHWIYSEERLQGGVTEKNLVTKAAEYLCEWRFEDSNEAEKAAHEFISFCRGRAWVFTDTGTTKDGENLYQFTHRTFLEYFTASHLVRAFPTPKELGGVLQSKIAKREWDVVGQLAFQLQDKNVQGAGDKLLMNLINKSKEIKGEKGWNLMSFAVRCLEYMVPRPKITREITNTFLDFILVRGFNTMREIKKTKRFYEHDNYSEPENILNSLLRAASENRKIIAESLEKILIDHINKGKESEVHLALEIGLNLDLTLRMTRREPATNGAIKKTIDFWREVSNGILESTYNRLEELLPKYKGPCFYALWRGKISMSNFITWHGLGALFQPHHPILFRVTFSPPYETLIYYALSTGYHSDEPIEDDKNLQFLKELAPMLLSHSLPWVRFPERIWGLPWHLREERFQGKITRGSFHFDTDALFSSFALLAVDCESSETVKELCEAIKKSKIPFFDLLRWTFIARFEQVEDVKVQAEIDKSGLSAEAQKFVWRWVRREINLVKPPLKSKKNDI